MGDFEIDHRFEEEMGYLFKHLTQKLSLKLVHSGRL